MSIATTETLCRYSSHEKPKPVSIQGTDFCFCREYLVQPSFMDILKFTSECGCIRYDVNVERRLLTRIVNESKERCSLTWTLPRDFSRFQTTL